MRTGNRDKIRMMNHIWNGALNCAPFHFKTINIFNYGNKQQILHDEPKFAPLAN